MHDNATAHAAHEYDDKVARTIPFYGQLHAQAADAVRSLALRPAQWLDTGCGTGAMTLAARAVFPDTFFTLADPSSAMLELAARRLAGEPNIRLLPPAPTQALDPPDASFDVVTAVQAHHYLDRAGREQATANCLRLLAPGGVYVTFENVRPFTDEGLRAGLDRWKRFQMAQGASEDEAAAHGKRLGAGYFPLTVEDHLALLRGAGFRVVEMLWFCTMQAGFYALK